MYVKGNENTQAFLKLQPSKIGLCYWSTIEHSENVIKLVCNPLHNLPLFLAMVLGALLLKHIYINVIVISLLCFGKG